MAEHWHPLLGSHKTQGSHLFGDSGFARYFFWNRLWAFCGAVLKSWEHGCLHHHFHRDFPDQHHHRAGDPQTELAIKGLHLYKLPDQPGSQVCDRAAHQLDSGANDRQSLH